MEMLADFDFANIKCIITESERDGTVGSSKPIIHINPDFSETWLKKPSIKGEDLDNTWKSIASSFPTVSSTYGKNITPPKLKIHATLPKEITDPQINLFLTGKPLAEKSGNFELKGKAFKPGRVNVGKDNKLVSIERLSRYALTEYSTSDHLSQALFNRAKLVKDNRDRVNDWEAELSLMINNMYLINATNTRLLNYIACINITAKGGIREKVLDQCKGNPNTKKVLQYSGYGNHNLFGDLPEEYEKEYLISGSHLYNSFVLQSKQWGEEKSFSSNGGGIEEAFR